MALESFTPNTVILSSKVNLNFTNLSNHGRNFTMKFSFPGGVSLRTLLDYLALPDNATIERVDLIADTPPVGAAIIADVERSTDGGGTWVTIFTGGTNRPQIADGARTGSTTTIDVPSVTANSHYFRAKVSQIGSTTPGSNLSVMVRGKYNLD